eukprot:gnl/TRDRNA2_/TRDRNA2_153754_c2_seq1.p1 gnl/TRDRNA2_/TRDRNA2_153754_c2~~gnl/TRDRNA2_/TRDRNA2_153754_c2_seq1.p1  ORF type:complete len:220 (-),score=21.87 gnl/TRDRNA2_/TRDRNA2_153754_c2_seq1:538-1197(-)
MLFFDDSSQPAWWMQPICDVRDGEDEDLGHGDESYEEETRARTSPWHRLGRLHSAHEHDRMMQWFHFFHNQGLSADDLHRLDESNEITMPQLGVEGVDAAHELTPGNQLVLFLARCHQMRSAVGCTHRWLRSTLPDHMLQLTIGQHIGLEHPSERGSFATLATEDIPDGNNVTGEVSEGRPRRLRYAFRIIPDARISTPSSTPRCTFSSDTDYDDSSSE